MKNTGYSVVQIHSLARKLQTISAGNGNEKEMYRLATDIMLECQHLREMVQERSQPRTIMDYINRIVRNGKN